MELQQRSASSSAGLLILLLVIIALAGGWFLVKPAYYSFRSTQDNLAAAETRLSDKQQMAADVDTLLGNYNSSESDLNFLADALPETKESPQILSTLESMAIANGLLLKTVALEQVVNQAPVVTDPAASEQVVAPSQQEVRINFTLTGSHDGMRAFLDALEKNLRLFDVQILTVSEPDDAGLVEFQVVATTYYQ